MKLLAAVMGKCGYEKWNTNKPDVFHFLIFVQSRKIPKKTVAGVARKQSSYEILTVFFFSLKVLNIAHVHRENLPLAHERAFRLITC